MAIHVPETPVASTGGAPLQCGYDATGALVVTHTNTVDGSTTETTLTFGRDRRSQLVLALLLAIEAEHGAISSRVMDIAKQHGIPYRFESY